MSNPDWPTFAEVETLAQKAHFDGFLLKLEEVQSGWAWVWLHESGMSFDGHCDSTSRAIAFVCALSLLPIVITVDANEEFAQA